MAALTDGTHARLPAAMVYTIVISLIGISCVVNTFSSARDISWRLGSPHNLWEPALWQLTSGIVLAALVPLARCGVGLIRSSTQRPMRAVFGNAALLVTFSVLHIAGMGLLRELSYRLAGWAYSYPWAHEALYEFRKDIFAYVGIAVMFWLAERPTARLVEPAAETVETEAAAAPAASGELWLRDGRLSILANPNEIVWVGSAGNYVEFRLSNARTHLIRTTLQAQEARLARFGIVRVHRSRLINRKRIVALEWRASGDFEISLDTGERVIGSRRFKAAVMAMGG